MSEPKHTPGPWVCGDECEINLTFDREAAIYPPHHTLTGGYQYGGPIAVVGIDDDDTGGMANARLIAAAPDLLAACRAALAMLVGRGDPFVGADWELGHRLSAAIGKATDPDYPRNGVEP